MSKNEYLRKLAEHYCTVSMWHEICVDWKEKSFFLGEMGACQTAFRIIGLDEDARGSLWMRANLWAFHHHPATAAEVEAAARQITAEWAEQHLAQPVAMAV